MAEKLEYKITLDGVEESNQKLNSFADQFKDVAIQAGKVTIALLAVSKGFDIISKSAEAFFVQQRAENQVAQALLTTGNAANLTAEELKKAATELQKVSNFGDEDILANATGSLLTFKNIAGDTFLRTQEIVVDMAEKFGGLQNSAMQVGFALNSPTEGLTRLRRTGIQFTDQQKEQIKMFEDTNQIVKAQAIILEELESQFGGLAKASINPITQIKNSWGDMVEDIGESFVPVFNNFSAFIDVLKENEGMAKILTTTIKIGMVVAISIATKAVIGLIIKMKALIATMTVAKALSGDWISILLSVGAGIGSVALMTKDWTDNQEDFNTKAKNTVGVIADIDNAISSLSSVDSSKLAPVDALKLTEETTKKINDEISRLEKQIEDSTKIIDKYDGDGIKLYDETNLDKVKDWFTGSGGSRTLTKEGEIIQANQKIIEDTTAEIEK